MRHLLVAVAGAAGLAAGCADAKTPTFPVSGKVTVNGQPAAGALVVFHPTAKGLETAARPFATVADDGTFQLTFRDPTDGAPEGEYGVTVVWNVKAKEAKFAIGEGGGLTDKLGGRFGDPRAPKLTAVVKKGEPNTFTFDLK